MVGDMVEAVDLSGYSGSLLEPDHAYYVTRYRHDTSAHEDFVTVSEVIGEFRASRFRLFDELHKED